MRNYDTLSEAINDLISKGYTYDFNLNPDCIKCASLKIKIHPEDFEVDEFFRFEGMSSTDDNVLWLKNVAKTQHQAFTNITKNLN